MTLKGRNDFIPIALVKAQEWKAVRYYCTEHDIFQGGDYECPVDGSIILWAEKEDESSPREMYGIFHYELSDATNGWVNIYWQTGSLRDERNWPAFVGRNHFMKLFKAAIGRKYAESHSENRGK